MKQHSALLPLPDELRAYGLNVVVMDGWDTAQGRYRWTLQDGSRSYENPPSGVLFHGTAGTRSIPIVRTRLGRWSSANAWTGLDDGHGILHSTIQPGKLNRPTIYLTAAGPARYSAGYGHLPVRDLMFNDIRPLTDAQGRDSLTALNRYTFNVENTHPNDGSLIDPDVFDVLVGIGVVLHQMFDWTERTLGHRTWTRRKPVDPWFTPGGLVALQDQIQDDLGQENRMLKRGDTGINVTKMQNYLNRWLTRYQIAGDPLAEDGVFGDLTETRVLQFQMWAKIEQTGMFGWFDAATMAITIEPDTGDDT